MLREQDIEEDSRWLSDREGWRRLPWFLSFDSVFFLAFSTASRWFRGIDSELNDKPGLKAVGRKVLFIDRQADSMKWEWHMTLVRLWVLIGHKGTGIYFFRDSAIYENCCKLTLKALNKNLKYCQVHLIVIGNKLQKFVLEPLEHILGVFEYLWDFLLRYNVHMQAAGTADGSASQDFRQARTADNAVR